MINKELWEALKSSTTERPTNIYRSPHFDHFQEASNLSLLWIFQCQRNESQNMTFVIK